MKLIIRKDRCPQDHRCPAMPVCPVQAISQVGNDLPMIDQEKCIQCGKCISFCPKQAFEFISE